MLYSEPQLATHLKVVTLLSEIPLAVTGAIFSGVPGLTAPFSPEQLRALFSCQTVAFSLDRLLVVTRNQSERAAGRKLSETTEW